MKTRLSSKGQVILPKSLRDTYHLTSGTEFMVEETDAGILLRPLRPPANLPPATVDEVFGMLAYGGPAKSLDEMDDAITAEVKSRYL